jgi:DNA-binding transcriptional MerR regulator
MLKINEVAKLTGTTVRTLHYYDEIGLLKPSGYLPSGYRLYDERALETLQQILFFRELDFPVSEIGEIMQSPSYDQSEALFRHRDLLLKKRERIDRLIGLTNKIIKGENTMSFQEFDTTEIDWAKQEYAAEVKERWGKTDAYAESQKRTKGYGKEQWQQINEQSGALMQAFSEHLGQAPDSPEVQELVKRWQEFISVNFYDCTNEILSSLGMMYTADERFKSNIDQYGAGTAELMSNAIACYCETQSERIPFLNRTNCLFQNLKLACFRIDAHAIIGASRKRGKEVMLCSRSLRNLHLRAMWSIWPSA